MKQIYLFKAKAQPKGEVWSVKRKEKFSDEKKFRV
jgi:hypothetical protein